MGWGGEMGGSGQAESLFCAVGEQGEGRAFWSWSCHWAYRCIGWGREHSCAKAEAGGAGGVKARNRDKASRGPWGSA